MKMILKYAIIILVLSCFGCAEHKVDTFQEWCEQISGEDLDEKYRPFWAVIFGVSFDGDAIRDDYTEFLNNLHLEKVNNRAPKMAWREGTELHLVSAHPEMAEFQELQQRLLRLRCNNSAPGLAHGWVMLQLGAPGPNLDTSVPLSYLLSHSIR